MATCLVALGSNVGDRFAQLERAIQRLDDHPSITVAERSAWFRTVPVGGPPEQGEFVNAAIRVQTSLSPEALFLVLREVESDLGRQRRKRWAARMVDLDLLLFDDLIQKTPQLEIPHPRLAFRRFVLEPAAEVARDMLHPVVGWTIGRLLDHLNRAVDYVALTGLPGVGKTELARKVAERASVRLIEDVADEVLPASTQEDGASNPAAVELGLLQRRGQLLAAQDWSQEPSAGISDFWIGQSLAYGRLFSSHDVQTDVEGAWRSLEGQIGSPKLLVLLDAPAKWLIERGATNLPPSLMNSADQLERLRSELTDVAFHSRHGPVLQLDATQPEWALTELTAAIEAMR
ncbi:MAG: 2-amino-4-hydroxy-6-hydroxymethyldihydropteridine diphosphokinase [Planctomycetes bacterium]|nr:2-amino-4-hydroxy-6-hydroxymethyldihydropteridine diphosphokinase [Planctomycetota bacterium]MBL7040106.1 2-amino-4-hydroxy-6-hydroxymethyldihydropteridine diphosphokinase [Pirellulaceae bacterium]